jgi:hypothetical protein
MRRIIVVSLGLAAAASLAACSKKPSVPDKPNSPKPVVEGAAPSAPLTPAPMPRRRPGLWSQSMALRGMTQTTKICIGEDTDKKMSAWGQAMGKNPCSKTEFHPTTGGWAFASECDMGESGHISSHGEATGDFNTGYTVKVSSVTSGASMPQANGAHEMTMQAKYEGACPADMKPGDISMNVPGMKGGMKINVEQMAAMRK